MNVYAIIIEDPGSNVAAYVPDFPGGIGAADTIEELEELLREPIEFHIEGMGLRGKEVSPPSTRVTMVRVVS
jgi:predicted RNase H-like HicB family nuclease